MGIGARVKAGRLLAGMSQQEVADALGVSKNMVSKYERGESAPAPSVPSRLAELFGVGIEYFYREEEVVTIDVAYRKLASLPAATCGKIEGQITERLERYGAVEHILGLPSLSPPTGESLLGQVATTGEAESAAARLRNKWGLGTDPIENLCEEIENHEVRVVLVPVEDRRFSGWSCRLVNGPPVVVVNGANPPMNVFRQRFTLAHELAHSCCELVGDSPRCERLANRFAGALLVPEEAARSELARHRARATEMILNPLKEKWGMSWAAWVHRLQDLDLLAPAEALRFWKAYNQRGYRSTGEPGDDERPLEQPGRLERLVRLAWSLDLVSDLRAAELSDNGRELLDEILGLSNEA
jgi:Zn-dependent peptidase ImmA (M78 family)/transcriptional regulator with XRE-family HTH domain